MNEIYRVDAYVSLLLPLAVVLFWMGRKLQRGGRP